MSVAAQPSNAPLLQASSLSYLGAFRVPHDGAELQDSLAYGGSALAINPANNSLLLTGHIYHERTAEISLESPTIAESIDQLPSAQFIRRPIDATRGLLGEVSSPPAAEYTRMGGQILINDQLIVSGYHYYDVAGISTASHLSADWPLTGSHDVQGPVSLSTSIYPRWLAGAMAPIPTGWQSAFGGHSLLTGLSGVSGASHSSVGPAAAAFSPGTLDGSSEAHLLVGYPLSQPLDVPEQTGDVWNLTSEVRGMAFPDGTRSLLFFGRHGIGEYCYGTGVECNDPVHEHQGTHAYPYRNQIWAYDAHDLAAVADGSLLPEEVQPYDHWELELPFAPAIRSIGGAVYDARTRRIYVSQREADGDFPLIHVLGVADDDVNAEVPVVQSPTPGSQLAGNGDVVVWQGIDGSNSEYWVYAGSVPGDRDYFNSGALGAVTSTPIGNLPVDGTTTVFIRLWYRSDGKPWAFVDQQYVAGTTVNKLSIESPLTDELVSGTSMQISWLDNGQGNTQFWLYAGSRIGAQDYENSGLVLGDGLSIQGLPANDTPVWLRLWYRSGVGVRWQHLDLRLLSVP